MMTQLWQYIFIYPIENAASICYKNPLCHHLSWCFSMVKVGGRNRNDSILKYFVF